MRDWRFISKTHVVQKHFEDALRVTYTKKAFQAILCFSKARNGVFGPSGLVVEGPGRP